MNSTETTRQSRRGPSAAAKNPVKARSGRLLFRPWGVVTLACWWFGLAGLALAAPIINSLSPTQGESGTQVVISGANFGDVNQVKFNNTLADFTAVSGNRILAILPINSITGPIAVVSPSGTAVTPGVFLVGPRISDFQPSRSATNSTVTIFGENFESANSVQFSDVEAPFQIVGPTQITTRVPFGATNGPIRVKSLAGVATTLADFIVTGPGPLIDSFSPNIAAPGDTLVIQGANFVGVTSVQINGVAATFSVPAQSQIRATVPSNATSGPVRVVTPTGSVTSTNTLLVTRAPVITSFSPQFGVGGVQVIISGLHFENATGVSFNGVSATGFGTVAENQLIAIVPANATTGPIRVTNSFGIGVSGLPFIITRAPIITNLSQTLLKPGEILTVSGANLTGATAVKFNGANAIPSVVADSQLHVTVPSGAKTGPISIVNTAGTTTSADTVFIITDAPYLINASPNAGPRGSDVILAGANFIGATAVRFNGASAAFDVTAPTQIHAVVPAAATSGRITVVSPLGTSTNDLFFFVPPRLTSFSPTNGVVGDPITIQGTNFFGDVSVVLGGAPVPFQVISSNVIKAAVVADTRSGLIAIGTPGGAIISTNRFTVLPRILSFTPTLGPAGTQVIIGGTSFFEVTNVSFNGTKASFTVHSPTEIAATVPAGATAGPILVTTPDGTAASPLAFVVTSTSDLAVTKTVATAFAAPPQDLIYSITITNRGPSIQTGVTVTDTLPAGAMFLSADSPRGGCTFTNGAVRCGLGILTNGTAVALTVQVRAAGEGVFTNRVSVQAVESDLDPGNNFAQAITILARPESRLLSIEQVPGTNQVVVSWPISPVNFGLQSSTSLNDTSSWTDILSNPAAGDGRNRLTNNVTDAFRFYRLAR